MMTTKLNHTRPTRLLLTAALLIMALAILFSMAFTMPQTGQAAAAAGPDLTVEITLDPPNPAAGQEVTVHFLVSNNGGVDAASVVTLNVYFDPADNPPTSGTADSYHIQVPSLRAGGTFELSRTYTFTGNGCDHFVYGWVDRDNTISEGDETNNLVSQQVCIGVECVPDDYETDNMCSAAGMLSENDMQARSFCDADNPILPDEDWIKFTAFAGVTYTLATSNQGAHAAPELTLYGACGQAPLTTALDKIVWNSPGNGPLYAKLNRQDGVGGPLTAYSLTLSSATGVTDNFEPDNRCADARDITTDGVKQTHLFQAPGDEDWVKFAVDAGESFIIIGDNTATGVNPLVSVFASCDQAPSNSTLAPAAAQVAQSSMTAATYYARVKNQNADNFGANAHYDLAVTAAACTPDAMEDDDDKAQAKNITVGAAARTHNFCPASDEDWVKFQAKAGKLYVLLTQNLGFASDTVIHLYDTNGTSEIAQNDDYGYTSGSRIVWQAPADGLYFAKVQHVNAVASGPNTQYDLVVREGVCSPDPFEANAGNNGAGDAAVIPTNGLTQTHNFCANALNSQLGDQDWSTFNAVAGGHYEIFTTGLGPNSDTVLELYASDGSTLLDRNDDAGQGRGATLAFSATTPGAYYVRVTQFNNTILGDNADYQLQVFATEPPTPTPTPTLTPTPTPSPTPSPTPPPSTAKTLILVNRQRVAALYSAAQANALMNKLAALADDDAVDGVVIQVENDPAVAAAYAAWTVNANTLADQTLANDVVAAIRNRLMAFLDNAPDVEYVVIAGDDRVIPFRRVLDRIAPTGNLADSVEPAYAPEVVGNGTTRAALAANMILTDDYLTDRTPSTWQDREHNEYDLFVGDYATGRLIESPDEIIAFIDSFLGGNKQIAVANALVTGYVFVSDSADLIKRLFSNDLVPTNATLIGQSWTGADLRATYLTAAPRFDIYSVNGHSTHLAAGAPDEDDLTAEQVLASATDLSGALVYSMGCHAGLNDPGVLDLPEAYVSKLANYVGNTGFGWGSDGVIFSEALMRNFTYQLLRNTESHIGPALVEAKQQYYAQARRFDAYDAKVMMQVTLYGLPMVAVQTSGNLTDDDPFPSADAIYTPPSAFGEIAQGGAGYRLPGSFGAFDADTSAAGTTYNLDGNVDFAVAEPVQPLYFANVAAPPSGPLRGAVFLGGSYSDTVGVDPVIGAPQNDYVPNPPEPSFTADEFYPAAPFTIRSSATISGVQDTVAMSLGQFRGRAGGVSGAAAGDGAIRVFDQMTFSTYYSTSPDRNAADIATIDGVLDETRGIGLIKVEASDSSGVRRVLVAFTDGQGQWLSKDLTFDAQTVKWSGEITGTVETRYFVQVVDNAGNVAVNENKGRYYRLTVPIPLAEGRAINIERRLYLPLVSR